MRARARQDEIRARQKAKSKVRRNVIDCSCGKRGYPSEFAAISMISGTIGAAGKRAYLCEKSRTWHLTSKPYHKWQHY